MYKSRVIALREYLAAVKTKTFIIGLLMMPLLMGGSALLQYVFRDVRDIKDKRFAVVNRTTRAELLQALQDKLDNYNKKEVLDKAEKQQLKPRLLLEVISPSDAEQAAIDQQRFELSEKARKGELVGFLEIIDQGVAVKVLRPTHLIGQVFAAEAAAATGPPIGALAQLLAALGVVDSDAFAPKPILLRYQSNQGTVVEFSSLAEKTISDHLRDNLAADARLWRTQKQELLRPAILETKALSTKDESGQIRDAADQTRFASVIVPMVLMILMFMVTLMTATPLMQSVVEEKMQRIAEVLLGSVSPFSLMMGKLVGMAGVSLTVSAVYLGGAYWAAHHFGFAENLSPALLIWFVIYQALAALMFGSLFIAIGAACTEMKETQNLMWPVMLLATLPMFLVAQVIRDPNSPVIQGLSFFPFATPSLMVARLSAPSGIPFWEPALGVVIVLAATVACIWAASRIFRIGILMQGKGAKFGEMVRWVFRG